MTKSGVLGIRRKRRTMSGAEVGYWPMLLTVEATKKLKRPWRCSLCDRETTMCDCPTIIADCRILDVGKSRTQAKLMFYRMCQDCGRVVFGDLRKGLEEVLEKAR